MKERTKGASPERTARFGNVTLGPSFPVRIMAVVNLSPESFYKGSVASSAEEVAARARRAVDEGADIIDIGGMSTAPYLKNEVPEEVEASRIREALGALKVRVPISVDTMRASVAEVALDGGAEIINDVSGLKHDARMALVVKEHGASLFAMAHSSKASSGKPIVQVRRALEETLRIARRAGLDDERVALDPGIGFFREDGTGRAFSRQRLMPWYRWDSSVLADLAELETLGRPIGVGVSRKSFLGKIAGEVGDLKPDERLPPSLAATAIAVMNGADLVRTHDARETVQAVRVAEAIARRGRRGARAS